MEGWRPVLKHLALVEDDMFSVKLHGLASPSALGHRRLGRRPRLGVAYGGRRQQDQLTAQWQAAVD